MKKNIQLCGNEELKIRKEYIVKTKYKLVVKTSSNTYVKERSKNKQHLEDLAIRLSTKSPNSKFYVVDENVTV